MPPGAQAEGEDNAPLSAIHCPPLLYYHLAVKDRRSSAHGFGGN